ncbi:MAG: hypothetical protein Q9193_004983 [Seirophora villosa]
MALVAYAARTCIRTLVVKQFLVEDALLLLAVVCLCGTTGLAFSNLHSLYNTLAVILHGPDLTQLVDTLNQIPEISKRNNAAATLWCILAATRVEHSRPCGVRISFSLFVRISIHEQAQKEASAAVRQ